MTDVVICSACGHSNGPQEIFCQQCGAHLRASSLHNREETVFVTSSALGLDDDNPTPADHRSAYFGRSARLVLTPTADGEPLSVPPFSGVLTIGRGPLDNDKPLLDLSPYDAKAQGVSREHAYLTRVNATIIIEDAGTLNGTYLNGKRISPVQASILYDGDTLRFGNLAFDIQFEQ